MIYYLRKSCLCIRWQFCFT